MQFTEGSRYLHVHIVATDLRRRMNLISSIFSSRILFSLDFINFIMGAWDNCTDGKRTSWGIITMRVEEWEKQENKWVKKTPTGRKSSSYHTREVTSRTEMQALRTAWVAGKSWIPCPKGENKQQKNPKAHKLEGNKREWRGITFSMEWKHNISSKLKCFQIVLIFTMKIYQIPMHLEGRAFWNVKSPGWFFSSVYFFLPDFVLII